MDKDLVQALRARGSDVLTASEAGMIGRSDEGHLKWAAEQGRVLYTFNVGDYYRIHREYLARGQSHAGLILARQQRYAVGEQTRRLLKLIATRSAEDMQNHIEFLNAWD